MVKRASWLSVTPEPERELPVAVATIYRGHPPPAEAVAQERARIERLVLRGGQRRWLSYLHRVVELIEAHAGGEDPDVRRARARAATVISNHHNLLLGLPGPGAKLTESDRLALARLTESDRLALARLTASEPERSA